MPETIELEELTRGLGVSEEVATFAHAAAREVIFGKGELDVVGEKMRAHADRRVLLVTDPGIVEAGHATRARSALEDAGLEVVVFDQVHENPTTGDVDRCLAVLDGEAIDGIVGLGGGSSMDTAKGANFIYTNGGEMKDYWGVGKALKPMLPMVAIPTTAGTGSECQSFALIADRKTHQKMACGDKKVSAAVAILDPELTLTQPASVTAHTGIDAIAHAVETLVSKKRNAISIEYSKVAFALLNEGFEAVIADPTNLEARARVLAGAAYAGTAIENSMLGAAHSAANPLTAHYGVIHGDAVGVMLPHVIRLNSQNGEVGDLYLELGEPRLDERIEVLLERSGTMRDLRETGFEADKISVLAAEASGQWTAQFNPVELTVDDFEGLYREASGVTL
ncbi:MAG: iron-containing alcohol dehydrogenase [Verrucomicrobiota bacterium]